MTRRILGFVEDQGAANFFVGLREELGLRGVVLDLLAGVAAVRYLHRRGEEAQSLAGGRERWAAALEGSDLVLVGTGENRDSAALEMIIEARARGVASAAIVDTASTVKERFEGRSRSPALHRPDWLIAGQMIPPETLVAMRVEQRNVLLVRNPYYDVVERLGSRLAWMDPGRKREELFGEADSMIILFLCELSDGLRAEDFRRSSAYSLSGAPESNQRTHVVLDELVLALERLPNEVRLVARLHPKENLADYSEYAGRVHRFSQDDDPLEVVYFADAVVGMTTSLLVEAALLGKPVLSIVPRLEERAWMPDVLSPEIPVVCTRPAIDAELARLVSAPRSVARHRLDGAKPSLAEALVSIL